jgi:hypothetical protein
VQTAVDELTLFCGAFGGVSVLFRAERGISYSFVGFLVMFSSMVAPKQASFDVLS